MVEIYSLLKVRDSFHTSALDSPLHHVSCSFKSLLLSLEGSYRNLTRATEEERLITVFISKAKRTPVESTLKILFIQQY